MSLEKRTPEAPRCGSVLPNALCIFQRTRSCALAAVNTAVSQADRLMMASLSKPFGMWRSSPVDRLRADR